ncbi:hypothetical protein [Inquilinus sp.]|jgi:uncharacterized protein YegP (UPF0339 family)|uniref:hypothetical protein n=1 Tax=Inquilinus sp. TaxID=1932117 RepID=UPI00378431AF
MNSMLATLDPDPYGVNDAWVIGEGSDGWRWTRFAGNSLIVGASTQGYSDHDGCVRNARRNGYRGGTMGIADLLYGDGDHLGHNDRWEFYPSGVLLSQRYRWRRISRNGEIVGASTEGYYDRDECVRNARRHGYQGK